MFLSVDSKTLGLAAAAATGVAVGYLLGNLQNGKDDSDKPVNMKTLVTTDPCFKYIRDTTLKLHPCQQKLMEATQNHPRHRMLSVAEEMQFLSQLAKHIKAKNTLDIGVYTGYSALSLALVLPEDGRVVACDITDEYVNAIGRPLWKEAGVENRIDLKIGPALNSLRTLLDEGLAGTFDFAFIDADKTSYDSYYEMCLELLRPGGVIAIDNVLWSGKTADLTVQDPDTVALRTLNAKVGKDTRVDASMLFLGDGTMVVFKK